MSDQQIEARRLEWFGGNIDAYNVYLMFIELTHTWDDLVDRDNDAALTESRINQAFMIALVYMPNNPFYQQLLRAMPNMWTMIVSAYETANKFERDKEPHGVEIAHSLRYAAGHVCAQAIGMCVPVEQARIFIPELWKDIFFDRFDEYYKEHMHDETPQ